MAKTGEPWWGNAAVWAAIIASFVLSANTWVKLAVAGGYAGWPSYAMPVAVDGLIVGSLGLWLSPVPETVTRFAKRSTYIFAILGVVAQSGFHAAHAKPDGHGAVAAVIAIGVGLAVGAFPPAVAAVAVHTKALMRRESRPAVAPRRVVAASVARPVAPVSQAVAAPVAATPPATDPLSHPSPPAATPATDTRDLAAKKALVEEILRQRPELSLRYVAKQAGVSKDTVSRAKAAMAS